MKENLIVGNQSSKLRAAPIFPEYVTSWIINELDEFDKRPGDAFFITRGQKNKSGKSAAGGKEKP